MHIEQGTQLENAGLRIGVVTGIVAICQWRIVVQGQQDHAGGTTMAERRDAGLTAVRLLAAIDAEFPRVAGERSVWTTGRIVLEPGAPSVIPGRAEILFQFRDVAVPVLERMEAALRMLIREANRRERCVVSLEPVSLAIPAVCDPAMMEALAASAEELVPGGWQRMPSGAGHDAQNIARHMPAAMLFVPSIKGISHHWAEDTSDADLAMGIRVLDGAVRRFLAEG
jgi:N-carbamoyl-L-amino-acid hydrolase